MNTERTVILDELDKLKTIADSLERALALMTLPSIEMQMTDDEKKDAFGAWLRLHYIIEIIKDRRIESLLSEWTNIESMLSEWTKLE